MAIYHWDWGLSQVSVRDHQYLQYLEQYLLFGNSKDCYDHLYKFKSNYSNFKVL